MTLDASTFFGVPWRTVVTDLDTQTVTFLDRLCFDRSIELALGSPSVITGKVSSYSPEVNTLHTDGYPFLDFTDRLIYMLRREGEGSSDKWVCRASGIVLPLEDEAQTDNAVSSFTAYDPWQVLNNKPIITDALTFPGSNGWSRKGFRADQLILELLSNYATYSAGTPHVDCFIDTTNGTIEECDTVGSINWRQGETIGEAITELVDADYCDVTFTPIYDPLGRPGKLAELNIYDEVGSTKNGAIMAWDQPGRSLVGIDNLRQGQTLANKVKFWPEQGPALGIPVKTNTASVLRLGEWWTMQFISARNYPPVVERLAQTELALRRRGMPSISVQPAAGRSPIPFLEYNLGDSLPVYASTNMREAIKPTQSAGAWLNAFRVYGISLELSDDGYETVSRLTLSPEDN